MDVLYRDGAKIGTGSTADAVRYESDTGSNVGGVFHTCLLYTSDAADE